MGIARGFAPQFGVQVSNVTVGTGHVVPYGATVRYSSQSEDYPDAAGETVGQYYWNHKLEVTIEVYPVGTSAANANSAALLAAGSGQTFQPGKTLVLTASNDSDLNRTWVIKQSTKNKRTDGRTTHTIDLESFITHGSNIAANEITV